MNSQNENQEQNLILYPARLKMLLVFAISLAFVVVGVWMVLSGDVRLIIMGIVSIAFFALCCLVCLVVLIHPFRILVVNEEGIRQGGLSRSVFVAWEEINAITSLEGRVATLNVYLSDAGRETFSVRYPRLAPISTFLLKSLVPLPQQFLPVLSISEMMLPVPARQVIEILQTRYQRQIERYNIDVR